MTFQSTFLEKIDSVIGFLSIAIPFHEVPQWMACLSDVLGYLPLPQQQLGQGGLPS